MGATQLQVGTVLDGSYEVTGVLGRGGMATVFQCRQLDDARDVAIKVVLVPEGQAAETRRRFFNELLLATRVRHPNIVEVYDFGLLPESGAPYIVMEHLPGRTLHRELRRRGPMRESRVVPLFIGMLSALAAAHDRGVVHKDLKPSNLFLSGAGTNDESLMILDFGVAYRVRDAEPGASIAGELSGTAAYMAPEYIDALRVWPGVDVYQVGLVLAEALSARPVVEGTPKECLRRHRKGRIELPPEVLTSPLRRVIERAVAHDPAARFADARQLLDALEAVQHSAPTMRRGRSGAPAPPLADVDGDPTQVLSQEDQRTVRLQAHLLEVDTLEATPAPASDRALQGRSIVTVTVVAAISFFAAGVGMTWWLLGG